ncbi:LLM class flavin-dependent oxidoreductase [Methyloligella sp. 2.7D]|uniref:LLM class flavin-dependent oxidoreductase n=1 Tax=unclassified Methyloligella TaxID=2625955 RepID=UPI00157C5708|nr:LLM class flavin-dependent oxidoreductase [Methyloligella sp. GL2]QKP76962.1 LLM class flavin-dependent oxidoreductase [Methyloligella sp. GL2]
MRIGLLQEGEVMEGVSYAQRYEEMIEEVALADQLGFSCWGTSEQHFSPPRFTVSAPEVLYAAIARHTKNIKLRIMCSVLLQWNHPVLVAERMATLDIVSNGRAEIGTARSNNLTTLAAFGVDPSTTREQWADSFDVLIKAFTEETLEHDGPFWKIPPVKIVPDSVQKPHPPIFVAASSEQSHGMAGEMGIGALCFESYFGFDYMQQCIDAYRKGLAKGTSSVPRRTENMGLYVATAFCDEDHQKAVDIAHDVAMGYFHFIVDLYAPLGKKSSYEYLDDKMKRLVDNRTNIDFLVNETPSVMIGTPDEFIARLRDLEARGIDEVLLRIDGVPHEDIMRSIELIGTKVIPVFQNAKAEAAE